VELELIERERVAGRLGRVAEELAHEGGGVDLHLCGDLVAKEGLEEKVEFSGFTEPFDTCIPKADALFFGLGDERDVGVGGERDADAGSVEGSAELCFGMNVDDDAVLDEGDVWGFRVDVTGRSRSAADIVTALRPIEELSTQSAFEGLGRDSDFNCTSRMSSGREKCNAEKQAKGEPVHDAFRIRQIRFVCG
jgi:hypothetical protein